MLGMKTYSKDYIDVCRARVEAGLRALHSLAGKVPAELEHRFFADQVLLLDTMFIHRLAAVEGKDGNPLNEVRVLCNSILYNRGRFQVDKLPGWPASATAGIKLRREASCLGLAVGDAIALTEADFVRLADAFFGELERRFLQPTP